MENRLLGKTRGRKNSQMISLLKIHSRVAAEYRGYIQNLVHGLTVK